MSVQSFTFEVPKPKKRRWGKPKPGESLKMLAAGSLAFAKAYSSVEKLEHELEAEIQRDKDRDPKKGKGIHRWRRKGGKFLLNKYILLFIVVINIIDCALVLGELILDLHHVKDILSESEESTKTFLHKLQHRYPGQFNVSSPDALYERILTANMFWTDVPTKIALVGNKNGTSSIVNLDPSDDDSDATVKISTDTDGGTTITKGDNVDRNDTSRPFYTDDVISSRGTIIRTGESNDGVRVVPFTATSMRHKKKSVWRMVGYVFHKTSLTISCILVLWVVLKIVCFGKHLLDRKLDIFDTFIILTSFIVDMIFVKGLTMYSLQDFVFILAFMLPWRVIRVTNSLVVAVKDHEHFRLKMLYTQKKKIEADNKQIRADRDNYREQVDALKKLCLSEGIDDWKIFQSLGNAGFQVEGVFVFGTKQAKQQIRPGGKGAMGSFASLAFGAFGGSKSSSFWSVLGTPKMRRGKSMELVDNKISCTPDNLTPPGKRNSKGRILSFLGSSSEYFRGKIKNGGHHFSVDSDPGFTSIFTKNSGHHHQNGLVGKRLVRGETIDTVSNDSLDMDKHLEMDDFSRQETVDSNVFDTDVNSSISHNSDTIQKAASEEAKRPPLCHSSRIIEESPILLKPRSASINVTQTIQKNSSTEDMDDV